MEVTGNLNNPSSQDDLKSPLIELLWDGSFSVAE